MITVSKNQDNLNESMGDISHDEIMMKRKQELIEKVRADKRDFSDPKYLRVVEKLTELGYKNSKFVGVDGFNFHQDYSKSAYLTYDNYNESFLVSVHNASMTPSRATELNAELIKLIDYCESLNFILAGDTNSTNKDRHV